jgi:sugar-specific transcriptional regulator TrmB/DNA-binding CsgD family transcriptional regulator
MSGSRHGDPLVTSAPDSETGRSLTALGLSADAEHVYRALLRTPDDGPAVIDGISAPRTKRAAAELEAAGLITRRPGRPVRYVPAAPGTAVEALILRREKELEDCRQLAAELAEQYRNSARRDIATQVIEVIEDRGVIFQRYVQLVTSARHEVLMFDKPPYVGPAENPHELDALRRGVSWRGLYSPEGLYPDRMEEIRRWEQHGEQARVYPDVPVKLLIADRSIALLPLTARDEPQSADMAILIHPCSLLDTLTLLFEGLWNRAVPLSRSGAAEPPQMEQDLLRLLAAGYKDEAIARQLGVSSRTVARKLVDIMREHGASTRFQLGLLLARQGWS